MARQCIECGQAKPTEEFPPDFDGPSGEPVRDLRCWDCQYRIALANDDQGTLTDLWARDDRAECLIHGMQRVVDQGSGPGFTGARIHWWTLACGCQQADTTADNLGAAE